MLQYAHFPSLDSFYILLALTICITQAAVTTITVSAIKKITTANIYEQDVGARFQNIKDIPFSQHYIALLYLLLPRRTGTENIS